MDKNCCIAEAIIKIDERGQLVFPKELRKKANIQSGDKFVVVSMKKDNEICCFSLIKADQFSGMVTNFLGPIMNDLKVNKA
ncbi:MAG: AbrB/MazE/SpoVT family DNA-binding domain-containing protein [archaeon]|nr:AbrB/MazE/SpoVT family DNA-binding domain-containing protein [archaeon]